LLILFHEWFCVQSSFDVNVVDGDDIVGAKFFGIIGASQLFSYQRSKSLLSQQIT
jgi:hypothetical protein